MPPRGVRHRRAAVDWLAEQVEHAPQKPPRHRYSERRTRVHHRIVPGDPDGSKKSPPAPFAHPNAATSPLEWYRSSVLYFQQTVYARQHFIEYDVDDRAPHVYNPPYVSLDQGDPTFLGPHPGIVAFSGVVVPDSGTNPATTPQTPRGGAGRYTSTRTACVAFESSQDARLARRCPRRRRKPIGINTEERNPRT